MHTPGARVIVGTISQNCELGALALWLRIGSHGSLVHQAPLLLRVATTLMPPLILQPHAAGLTFAL